MAAVILPETYVDGLSFDTSAHAINLFSDVGGQGIFSEFNGYITSANLNVAFNIRDEHVQSEEAVQIRGHWAGRPLPVYNDAFPSRAERDFIQIGNLAAKFRLKWDADCVLWQWHTFINHYRQLFVPAFPDPTEMPIIVLKAFIDGAEVPHTRRPLPQSALQLSTTFPSPPFVYRTNFEDLAAQSLCMSAMSMAVSAGPHSVSVQLFMEPPTETTVNYTRDANFGSTVEPHILCNRVTFGMRNAMAVAF